MRSRVAALVAAAAVLAVSVQAGVIEACGLCPTDCPMHADHEPVAAKKSEAKMRCHGARHAPADGELQFRRPPCRTSMTLSASLLPPFVLQATRDPRVFLSSSPGATCETRRLFGRHTAPETPPPIPFV